MTPGRTSLIKDLSWLSSGYLGRSLAYLLLTAVLARALDPAGYGQLSLFLALSAGIAYLAGSWPFLAVPVLAAQGRDIRSVLTPALTIAYVGTLATSAVFVPAGWALLSDPTASLPALVLYAAALVGLQGLYAVYQTVGRMRNIALVQTLERCVAVSVIGLVAVASKLTIPAAEATLALSAAGVCAVAFVFTARRMPLVDFRAAFRLPGMRDVSRAVGLMAIVTTASYVVAWIDILLLAALRSDREVGVYALAYQIFAVVVQFGSLSVVASLPRHARRAASGEPLSIASFPRAGLDAGTRLWSAGVLAVAVASGFAVEPIFGAAFSASLGPVMVLLAGAALLAPYYAAVSLLTAHHRVRPLAWIAVLVVVINISLDLALIPFFGVWGPAAATAVQSVVAAVAVVSVAAGSRRSLAAVGAAAPAAAATLVLARYPESAIALGLAGALASALAYSGLRILRLPAIADAPAISP
jgi:O-antigen/teichoic acid export membrane protein